MELMPCEFWSLTVREFWIKHDAFIRAEDRRESAFIRHALRSVSLKPKAWNQLNKQANVLRRYPVKRWLR
jgi:hypothetical protein